MQRPRNGFVNLIRLTKPRRDLVMAAARVVVAQDVDLIAARVGEPTARRLRGPCWHRPDHVQRGPTFGTSSAPPTSTSTRHSRNSQPPAPPPMCLPSSGRPPARYGGSPHTAPALAVGPLHEQVRRCGADRRRAAYSPVLPQCRVRPSLVPRHQGSRTQALNSRHAVGWRADRGAPCI